MRYGSLFAGYGGLELGVQSVLGGSTAWHCEIEPAPSRILAHHWPDVPNLGDITAVDWDAVEPVDVLTGGFPCQDVSHAGKRLGLKPGTRSGLWAHMAYAIDKLRPRLVVAENVRGLLSAEAGSDLEPCAWCVGDGEGSPLRALGAVLGDLADLGYDAQWVGVRAADAGAPHGRFRVFVFAWPADSQDGREPVESAVDDGPAAVGGAVARAGAGDRAGRAPAGVQVVGRGPGPGGSDAADADGVGHERPGSARGRRCGPADGGVAAAHADVAGREGREPARGRHLPARGAAADAQGDGRHEGWTEPARIERGPDAPERGDTPAADADGPGAGRDGGAVPSSLAEVRRAGVDLPAPIDGCGVAWGEYEPAIRRWEHFLGRVAPAPTEPGRNGQPRLSPAFVEWLMGLAPGHVTDVGLTRNEQLKALGNGVVPQQAALATRIFLATHTQERAA